MSTTPAPQHWSHNRLAASLHEQVTHLVYALGRALRCVAFWLAVLLPATYLPLIAAGFVEAAPVAFVGLCAGNGVLFRLGHEHRPAPR